MESKCRGSYKAQAQAQREQIIEQTGFGKKANDTESFREILSRNKKILAFRELLKKDPTKLEGLNLSKEDAEIIHAWTTPDYYKDINAVLRGEKEATQFELDFIEKLNNALDKLDNFKGTVYRDLDSNFPIKELLENYQKGGPYKFKGFSASDKNPDMNLKKWKHKPAKYRLEIKSKTGKSVKQIAWENPKLEEQLDEVLFKDGTKFKIIDIDKSVKPIKIILEKYEMTPDEFRKLSKEEQEKFMEDVINPPDDLPIEYTDEKDVPAHVLNWTPEQVEEYYKSRERYSN